MAPAERITPGLVRVSQVAFAILILIRIALDIAVPPIGDEAYYWMWGQKLGWSYLDHPPLHAWLLHIVGLLLGWNIFSLRVLTWVTLAGSLWIFWFWAKRLKPDNPQVWFWPTAAIYLASPLFFIMSAISFHDHLLMFLCLLSAHLFLVFAEKWEATGHGYRWLYAAGGALGLAVLTKYNGVLFGLGVAVFFIARRPLRPLWRSPHLYLAALLAVAIQAPVFWWNFTEGFASYHFHLAERWGGGLSFRPDGPPRFLLDSILFVSPFLLLAIIRVLRGPSPPGFATDARVLAASVLAASGLAMLGLSFVAEVYFYWDILAALLLMPLVAGTIGPWGLGLHFLYGITIAAAAVFGYGVIPFSTLSGGSDWYAASNFGWPEVAARIDALQKDHPVGFIATTRYTTAAQLGYAMHDPDVTAIADRRDEYDYWFDVAAHDGQDALVVSDPTLGTAEIAPHFDTLTLIETVPYTRFGYTIYAPGIYLGHDFHMAATK
jgi:4-amino-4-deoxy-L-arabinose transferase-like glycosyltransferase